MQAGEQHVVVLEPVVDVVGRSLGEVVVVALDVLVVPRLVHCVQADEPRAAELALGVEAAHRVRPYAHIIVF